MLLQTPVIGISIRRQVTADSELAKRLVRAAVDLGAGLIDFRDSFENKKFRDLVIKELSPDTRIVLRVGAFYPTFENILREVRDLVGLLGRPIDVLEIKRPVLLVSLREALRAIKYSVQEGYALGFSVIGAWPGDIRLIESRGMRDILSHLKFDINVFSGIEKVRSTRLNLFSSSALDGGRIMNAGLLSLGRRKKVMALREVAMQKGVKPAQVALAWLRQNRISAAPSVSNVEHLQEALDSNKLSLSTEELEELG